MSQNGELLKLITPQWKQMCQGSSVEEILPVLHKQQSNLLMMGKLQLGICIDICRFVL